MHEGLKVKGLVETSTVKNINSTKKKETVISNKNLQQNVKIRKKGSAR